MVSICKAKKFAIGIGDNLNIEDMLNIQNENNLSEEFIKMPGGAIGVLSDKEIKNCQYENPLIFVGEPIIKEAVFNIENYKDAEKIIPCCDGAFVAIYLDRKHNKLVIVSDSLGLQPFYYKSDGEKFLASGETRAFGAERDLAGWGAFFSWGHLIGTRTLVKNLNRLESASILNFDIENKILNKNDKKYWNFNHDKKIQKYCINDILESFLDSLRGYSNLLNETKLLLSGGFDSRFILFSLKSLNISPASIIVSHDDELKDLDGRIAEQCALCFDVDYKKINIEKNFFSSSNYLEYLKLSDASTLSMFLFISKLSPALKKISPKSVYDGFIPGFMLNASRNISNTENDTMKDFISRGSHSYESATWDIIKRIFKRNIVEAMYEGYCSDLKKEVEKYSNDNFGISEFNLLNRGSRRVALNPCQVYSNYTRPVLPGMTKDFLSVTSAIPSELKQKNEIYLKLFKTAFPEACNIPFVSGAKLISVNRNLSYLKSRINVLYCNFAKKYPSIFKFNHSYDLIGSKFFSLKFLEDDGHINLGELQKIDRTNPYYLAAWKMLFHWVFWKCVHNGKLDNFTKYDNFK